MERNPLLNRPLNHKLRMEVPNNLGFHKSSSDLDVTIGKPSKAGYIMYKTLRSIIGIISIVSFVGIFYYFLPGFNHIGTQGTSWEPTPAFLCIIVFLISIGLTSDKKEKK
jgi:hypothetical protein